MALLAPAPSLHASETWARRIHKGASQRAARSGSSFGWYSPNQPSLQWVRLTVVTAFVVAEQAEGFAIDVKLLLLLAGDLLG